MPKPMTPVWEMNGTTLPIAIELPAQVYQGIGMVTSSHAFLERRIQEMLYDLMLLPDYPQGRVAFAYRSAPVLFKTICDLIVLWGFLKDSNLQPLEVKIRLRTNKRDQLAHGVWVKLPSNEIALNVSDGIVETAGGRHNCRFLPVPHLVPKEYYEQERINQIKVANSVEALRASLKPELDALLEKYRTLRS